MNGKLIKKRSLTSASSLFFIQFHYKSTSFHDIIMLRKKLKLDPIVKNENSEEIISGTVSKTNTRTNSSLIESSTIASKILKIEREMCDLLKKLTFSKPVNYVYNPLEYAWEPHVEYVSKYCNGEKAILFLGINPGPFGMCQTGVPFGEVDAVKNFLQIEKPVLKPNIECPERPIKGFHCPRSEVSGQRLWGYFKQLCGSPEVFFKNSIVYNYCPLAFMKTNGTNVTPAELHDETAKAIEDICDKALLQILELLKIEIVVGIGKYSEKCAIQTLKKSNGRNNVNVFYMPHPSPRAPNNTNWKDKAEKFLLDKDLMKYFSQK